MVKKERAFAYNSNLNDWEIIAAFSYCKKTREQETPQYKREFLALCEIFFEGDIKKTENSLDDMLVFYTNEFSKRNAN